MKKTNDNGSALYFTKTKIGNLPNGQAHIVTYHTNDLLKLWQYIESTFINKVCAQGCQQHKTISFMNVIDKATGKQITSYTTLFRPGGAKVSNDDLARYTRYQQSKQFAGNIYVKS